MRDAEPPFNPTFCPNGERREDVVIQSKADIEQLRGCTSVKGSVLIVADGLSDLRGLESLHTVQGSLSIAQQLEGPPVASLRSLAGLEGLRTVGNLALTRLGIESLEAFAGLQRMGRLTVRYLAALRDLKGLENAEWDEAEIEANAKLESLHGLGKPASRFNQLTAGQCPRLQDLSGLPQLRELDTLRLVELPLRDLRGLEGLTRIGGASGFGLEITRCNNLRDLSGLSALQDVSSAVLSDNAALETLGGAPLVHPPKDVRLQRLPKLRDVSGFFPAGDWKLEMLSLGELPALSALPDLNVRELFGLSIGRCDALRDFTGFEDLQRAGLVSVSDCAKLESMNGLGGLQQVGENIFFSNLPALASLHGFASLSKLHGLDLKNLDALSDLSGLEQLADVEYIHVVDNDSLVSLRGLQPVQHFGGVQIQKNHALTQCEIDGFLLRQAATKPRAYILDNGPEGICNP